MSEILFLFIPTVIASFGVGWILGELRASRRWVNFWAGVRDLSLLLSQRAKERAERARLGQALPDDYLDNIIDSARIALMSKIIDIGRLK